MTDDRSIHLGRKLDPATLDVIADIICGDDIERYPKYRTGTQLTRFFKDAGINATHNGDTRKKWVIEILEQLTPQDAEKVILRLTDLKEYRGSIDELKKATKEMNAALAMDDFRVSFDSNKPVIKFANPVEVDDETIGESTSGNVAVFLNKQFSEVIKVSDLNIDAVLTDYLQDRVDEIQNTPKDKVHLGSIFLLGSTLEGILLAVGLKNQQLFMSSKSAPKDAKTGKTLKVHEWKLSALINTAYEVGYVSKDVKEFTGVLRDFRNYIHPYHQMSHKFRPDQDTVDICWHVFKAAFSQLKKNTK